MVSRSLGRHLCLAACSEAPIEYRVQMVNTHDLMSWPECSVVRMNAVPDIEPTVATVTQAYRFALDPTARQRGRWRPIVAPLGSHTTGAWSW